MDRDAGSDCVVCMDKLKPGASTLVMPCEHEYHPPCITPWLKAKGTFPLSSTHTDTGERDSLVLSHFLGGQNSIGWRIPEHIYRAAPATEVDTQRQI